MHVLILDMTHGGEILTDAMIARGNRVTCVDIYGIASAELMDDLMSKGAELSKWNVPKGHYDLLLSPVHCPDRFLDGVTWGARNTFHQAVGDLIDDGRFRIEVTGVKGKTSVCYMLAHILDTAGMNVFVHSSRGQGPWINGMHRIESKVSIAPTSMLRLPQGDYGVIICESSLGGSGKADIAVITNIADDYGIAENTGKASDAKASILCGNVNIVRKDEIEIWGKYTENDLKVYGGRVAVLNRPKIWDPLDLSVHYRRSHEISMDGPYVPMQYLDTVELVLEICDSMDIPAESVMKGLESFMGVPGRGELSYRDGRWVVRERNPGISHISIGHVLDTLGKMGALDDAVMVIDPMNRKVCEKMDMDAIRDIAEDHGIRMYMAGDDVPDSKVLVEFIKEGYQ